MPRLDHPWVRNEHAPIYVLDYPSEATPEAINAYYDKMAEWYRMLTAPVACVALVNNVARLDALERQLVATREKELEPYQRQYLRGTALIVESTLKRGMITAVFWTTPPCYRWKVFTSFDEGCFWANAQLHSLRPSVPTP